MKIGVISDIHLKRDDGRISAIIDRYLKDVDMFFLCGDFTSMEIHDLFTTKEVHAVAGNMDDYSIKSSLPIRKVIDIMGHKIGLIHGFGAPANIEERISREFSDVDCIVFGHTHSAQNERIGDVLFFNPGSPTDKRFASYNSVGVLNVTADGITGEIVRI